jgi:hypothetical protein
MKRSRLKRSVGKYTWRVCLKKSSDTFSGFQDFPNKKEAQKFENKQRFKGGILRVREK